MTATVDIPLSAPANLRDLAGIRIAGGEIRPGFALRADDLSTIDEATAAALVEGGLASVIDLRSRREVEHTGRGPFAGHPVTFHHMPFLTDVADASADGEDGLDQATYGTMYIRMFESAAPLIVQSLAIIAASNGAAAFHCAAGQDRTGVMAASLLIALGADREAIVADYVRTGENKPALMARLAPVMGALLAGAGFEIDIDEAARQAMDDGFSPEPMEALLDHLAATHGSPLDALRAAGLTDGLITALRERAAV